MARSVVLIIPWLLLAGVARAQTPPAEPPPPAPPPLVDAEEPSTATKQVKLPSGTVVTVPADSALAQEAASTSSEAPRREPPMHWSARLLLEGLGGTLAGGLGLYAGALVATSSDPGGATFFIIAGGLLGVGTGVLSTGHLLGTDGSWTSALIGEALGGAAGIGLVLLGASNAPGFFPLLLLGGFMAPVAGAVIGLELFGRKFGDDAQPSPDQGVSWRTMLVPVQGGAVLAFGGRM